jgi:hypothetical protein
MSADICVVMPTIREEAIDCLQSYVENARQHGFDTDRLEFVVVTEDFCDVEGYRAALMDLGVSGRVFDESGRDAWFEDHGIAAHRDLIPAASHAQTSFGLLYLWANEHAFCVFLDDDTRPHGDVDFFGRHLSNLARTGPIDEVRSDERWVNVLHQAHDEHGLYPRGYPYGAMGETVDVGTANLSAGEVVASQGLWTNVPDLDAVRILQDGDLSGQAETRLTADHFGDDFVAARDHYLTVCSMNLAFRRKVVPAFYQLPMDDNQWEVGRFDDIWSGVFLKRACDLLGRRIVNGGPLCRHDKAPRSTFGDLVNEAPGLELNEHVWEIVDEVDDAESFHDAFAQMAERLAADDWSQWNNGAFLTYVGQRMQAWLDCLDALEASPTAAVAEPPAADD